ncbi:proline racemase family protein [Castellaniella hirudinis]|uniref:proline racemase family protein n=1 Tax=Castellaniella hirudinis TaxID=1144617 RepID=UPI0039C11DD7
MQATPALELWKVHCQGEQGHVLMSGAPEIPGGTLLEKMDHLNHVDDRLRRFVTREPRAHLAQSVNLLVDLVRADADAGFIVLQADRAHPMSGSNCICVVTALLESGRVAMQEPETIVRLDTPAGLIVARAACRGGRCLSVSLENVPCFVEALDVALDTRAWGTLRVDIAFGGVYYALVDVGQIGLSIAPAQARALAEAGIAIKRQLAREVQVQHPVLASLSEIAYVMFRQEEAPGVVRTCTTLLPGRVDRSPCGTGSSANLAVNFARGRVREGDGILSRSIIGGEFRAEVSRITVVGDRQAIVPRVTGSAYVYGRETLFQAADDPFAEGFVLSDTWGSQVDLLG